MLARTNINLLLYSKSNLSRRLKFQGLMEQWNNINVESRLVPKTEATHH
jgi:hypothetical protein